MRIVSILWCVAIIAVFTIVLLLPGAAAVQSNNDPEMPRVLLDTHYVPPTGAVINVAAGDSFQAALNAARPGDTIILQAGVTYTTPPDGFIMPNKAGAGWVVIKSSNMAGLPGEGVRVTPGHAASMPRILTTGLWPAVSTAPGAHHYRFIGIELAVAPDLPHNYGIISLGDGSSAQNSLNVVPHDIILDRCYIHGNATGNISRGIALNSARTAVIDSYISNCHGVGYDTQAIAGWNGPGPFKIVNNYLEGAAENVMFGGSSPAIANLVPSDIEFRRNHCYKPLSWKQDEPNYGGIAWMVKNLFELKNAQRLLIDGNIFENNWAAHQSGLAIVFTPRGESGQAPWAVVQDVTFTNNIVRHSAGGINIVGYDDSGPSRQTQRVSISNNLFDDIGTPRWGVNGRFLQIIDGTAYVKVNHNTVFHTSHIIVAEGRTHTGFVYTNNISRHNSYGVFGTGSGTGISTLNSYFPGYVFARSLLADGPPNLYPPGNFFPPALESVGFIDLSGGNYRLAAGSPYKGAGTDGKDIGADIDQLQAAMGAAVVAPSIEFFGARGGIGFVNVTAAAGCAWTAESNDSWIVVVSSSGGSGNGVVAFELRENFTGGARMGTIAIAGQDFTVVQNGGSVIACGYSISPGFQVFSAGGGNGFIDVGTDAGCAWHATTNAGWLNFTSATVRIGNGRVHYTVSPNIGSTGRNAVIKIGNKVFLVKQKAG